MGCPYQAPLLVCLPTPVYIFCLLTYRPRPVQANRKSAPVFVRAGDAVSKQQKMGRMPTVRGNRGSWCCIKLAENEADANKNQASMPLGFFTGSFPGESMTLSPVTLARYYQCKIPIFDAKPLISESVALSLLWFSSANHQLSQSRRRILNVTEFDISYSVK